MKKLLLTMAFAFGCYYSYAQNSNPWPTSGSVGIGTTTPVAPLQVVGNIGVGTGYAAGSIPTSLATRQFFIPDINSAFFTTPSLNTTYYGDDLTIKAQGHPSGAWYGSSLSSILKGGNLNLYAGVANDSGNNGTAAATYTGGDINFYSGVAGYGAVAGQVPTVNYGNIVFNTPTGSNQTDQTWTPFMTIAGGKYVANTKTPPKLLITGGNVGIGTTNPDALLTIGSASTRGTLSVYGSTSGTALINLVDSRTGGRAYTIYNGLSGPGDFNIFDQNAGDYRLTINSSGNVGIGTSTPDAKLAVNGTIHTQEVKVDMIGWSDYVFKSTYKLPLLSEVKTYIDQNQHLPEIPSEADVKKDGINLGEMNKLLLKKVEELTLYLVEKDKEVKEQQDLNKQILQRLESLEKKN